MAISDSYGRVVAEATAPFAKFEKACGLRLFSFIVITRLKQSLELR